MNIYKISLIIIISLLLVVSGSLLTMFIFNPIVINKVQMSTNKVYIEPDVKVDLDNIYTDDLEIEVPACLSGNFNNNSLTITGVEKAKVIFANETSAEYIQCPPYISGSHTIGTIHNHPGGNCMLSDTDIKTYADSMLIGQKIIGLKCRDGYVFYILMTLSSEVKEYPYIIIE